jgi:hypothetical protein
MQIKQDIKDYLVAREMYGSNTKEQCHIVKKLKEKGIVTPHCEGWSLISLPNWEYGGYLISNELLESRPVKAVTKRELVSHNPK